MDVDHDDVGAATRAQKFHCGHGIVRVQDFRALVEGDLGGGGKLSREISDDQNTHGFSFSRPSS